MGREVHALQLSDEAYSDAVIYGEYSEQGINGALALAWDKFRRDNRLVIQRTKKDRLAAENAAAQRADKQQRLAELRGTPNVESFISRASYLPSLGRW